MVINIKKNKTENNENSIKFPIFNPYELHNIRYNVNVHIYYTKIKSIDNIDFKIIIK